jgi:DNA polymerase-3 subunit delta'
LSVDQVRELVLKRAEFTPHEGRARVFIVRRAEELSISASNALLKTLEEPRPQTHFILMTATIHNLLPTIRSRTERVRFGPLPDEVICELLGERGLQPADAARIARVAGGSMSVALAMADPRKSEEEGQFVAKAMEALRSPGLEAALELAELAKKSEKAKSIANIEAFAAALAMTAKEILLDSGQDAYVAASRHSVALSTLRDIDANASIPLAIEAMCIKMRAMG